MIDQQSEQLHGRGIDPVQVLDDQQHGRLGRQREEYLEQCLQRSVLLALRAHRRKRKALRSREREQRCQQREALVSRDSMK